MNDNWEQELDKKFKHVHHPMVHATNIVHDTSELKAFIRSLLSSQKAAILEKVEAVIELYGRKGEEADTRIMKGEQTDGDERIVADCVLVEKVLNEVLALPELQAEDSK